MRKILLLIVLLIQCINCLHCFSSTNKKNTEKMDQNKNLDEQKHSISLATMKLAWKMMQGVDSNSTGTNKEINKPTKNHVMSPFSIQMALNLLLMGSSGVVRQELLDLLNYSKIQPDGTKINQEFNPHELMNLIHNEIQQQINKTNSIKSRDPEEKTKEKKAEFQVANLLLTNYEKFGQMPDNLNENYLKSLNKYYRNVKIDSFKPNSGDIKESAKKLIDSINQWVNTNTKGKIQMIFNSEEDLGDFKLLLMVIANSVYFKSAWSTQFNEFGTKDDFFYSNSYNKNDTLKEIKFMRNLDEYDYLELRQKKLDETIDHSLNQLNCQVLGIPFKTSDLSMVFILPKLSSSSTKESLENHDEDKFALEKLEKKLDAEKLMKIFELLERNSNVEVDAKIPKFKFERQLDVRDVIENKLKSGDKIFKKLLNVYENLLPKDSPVNKEKIGVDKIMHKALIEIDENGVEAAAVTSITMTMLSSFDPPQPKPKPPKFIADHPFLFFVSHKPSRMPLFMGRVTKL